MKDGPLKLLLDSFMVGVVMATLLMLALLWLDIGGTGAALSRTGPLVLTFVWAHLTILATPFGTLAILSSAAEHDE
jgi:hypothetical protein